MSDKKTILTFFSHLYHLIQLILPFRNFPHLLLKKASGQVNLFGFLSNKWAAKISNYCKILLINTI